MGNPLGQKVAFSDTFDPNLLFTVDRSPSRERLGIQGAVSFTGIDRWNCFELSWLDARGAPAIGIMTLEYPAESPRIVESKSLKLFLGSLYNTKLGSAQEVEQTIQAELSFRLGLDCIVKIKLPHEWENTLENPPGVSIDTYSTQGEFGNGKLLVEDVPHSAVLHSNLLRSICPVTGQPDWGTVVVSYQGKALIAHSLLAYLIAHRNYDGFHEECCERIFLDILHACSPTALTVGCFYTRRGGIDINPIRWLTGTKPAFNYRRLSRQ